uniref:Uncharacterized protein n=1 Tax=Setaria italica TaxID=4555 RepID=K3Z181_SETIT
MSFLSEFESLYLASSSSVVLSISQQNSHLQFFSLITCCIRDNN